MVPGAPERTECGIYQVCFRPAAHGTIPTCLLSLLSPSLPSEWSNKGVAWIAAPEAYKVMGGILGSGHRHGVFLPSQPPVSLRSEWTGQVNAGQHALQIPSEPQGLQLEPGGEDPQDSGDQSYWAR